MPLLVGLLLQQLPLLSPSGQPPFLVVVCLFFGGWGGGGGAARFCIYTTEIPFVLVSRLTTSAQL